jgi:spore germination protein KC
MVRSRIGCLFLSISLILTGCWDSNEVDDMAYVISLGLDQGTHNKLQVSMLIAIPKNITEGGGKSASGTEGKSKNPGSETSEVVTVETPTITAGFNMINAFISREISLAHLKAIVFSEKIARAGVKDFLDYFERDREVRSTASVIVARGTAEEFLRSLKPVLETNPSKYIELTANASSYTSFIPKTSIKKFIAATLSYDEQAFAVMGGINKQALHIEEPIPLKDTFRRRPDSELPNEGEYLPGNVPRKGDVERELMGTAIFDGDRMVGEFNALETSVMLMLRGDFHRNFWSIIDPGKKRQFVAIDFRQAKAPLIKVSRRGNQVKIKVTLHLEGSIMEIQSNIQYERQKQTRILEKSIAGYISAIAERTIKIAQQEYKADVFMFGNRVRRTFWLQDDWEKANWKATFSKALITVDTKFLITRSGLLYKTNQVISSKSIEE